MEKDSPGPTDLRGGHWKPTGVPGEWGRRTEAHVGRCIALGSVLISLWRWQSGYTEKKSSQSREEGV